MRTAVFYRRGVRLRREALAPRSRLLQGRVCSSRVLQHPAERSAATPVTQDEGSRRTRTRHLARPAGPRSPPPSVSVWTPSSPFWRPSSPPRGPSSLSCPSCPSCRVRGGAGLLRMVESGARRTGSTFPGAARGSASLPGLRARVPATFFRSLCMEMGLRVSCSDSVRGESGWPSPK